MTIEGHVYPFDSVDTPSDGAIYAAVSQQVNPMDIGEALNWCEPEDVQWRLETILAAAGVEFEGRLEWPTYVSFPDGKRFVGTLYLDTNRRARMHGLKDVALV